MSEDRRKILEMLAEGKLKVDEAERLLAALTGNSDQATDGTQSKSKSKYLRVLVEPAPNNKTGDRVNIRVPLNLIRAGLKWASFIPQHAQGKVNEALQEKGIQMDINKLKPEDLEELILNLNDLQVEVEGNETVKVFCE